LDSSSTTEAEGDTRWRLDLEYDGRGFHGWQLQPGHRTVQGAVEEALFCFLGHPTRVYAAGRTDAGVHALQQVSRFDTHVERRPHQVVAGLNSLLPGDVAAVHARVAPGFLPRRDEHCKGYRYRLLSSGGRSPLRRHRTWKVRPLDVVAMREAAEALVGTHDFAAFRAAGCSATTTTRTVRRLDIEESGREVHVVAEGTGFLRHMIRIITGTLVEVGLKRRPPSWVTEVLNGRRRTLGQTAPATGLCLEWIAYDGDGADQEA
jgi:tRNA pseudouridine38-40 synthase